MCCCRSRNLLRAPTSHCGLKTRCDVKRGLRQLPCRRPRPFSARAVGLALARDHGLAFCDALIIASAIEAGCDMLFTEDMQHDRKFDRLAIVNPFLESAA